MRLVLNFKENQNCKFGSFTARLITHLGLAEKESIEFAGDKEISVPRK